MRDWSFPPDSDETRGAGHLFNLTLGGALLVWFTILMTIFLV